MVDPSSETKQAALDRLHAYRSQLESQFEAVQQKLDAVRLSIELLVNDKLPDANRLAAISQNKYVGIPLQKAVVSFLRGSPETDFKAGEVAHHLLRDGFVSNTKNFPSQVGAALNRLVKKGFAARRKDGIVWVYRLKGPVS